MAYKEIEYSEEFLNDLLARRELYKFKINPAEYDFRNPDIVDELQLDYLKVHSYQNFIKNLINPNTPYKRLLVKHGTGVGKTLTAIIVGLEFIKLYKQHYNTLLLKYPVGKRPYNKLDEDTPSVFVIGFGGTKTAFIRDLINYPSLGIISVAEREQLLKYQQIAKFKMIDDIKNLNSYFQFLRKKITNKRYGGFFKFYGYRELVNRLFTSTDIDVQLIERDIEQGLFSEAKGVEQDVTLEEVIKKYIEEGKIQVDTVLLEQFKNSIVICDESHNLYNSVMKNNYGVAIQYILDTVENVRALFLTATPINNSPSEIVDIINLLTGKNVKKKTYFTSKRDITEEKIKEIGKLLFGRVSFLEDLDLKYYPRRIIDGVELENMPFLKFIPTEMSEFHQKTYNHFIETKDEEEASSDLAFSNATLKKKPKKPSKKTPREKEESPTNISEEQENDEEADIKIPINSYALYDMVFPNPDSTEYGLFRTTEIKRKIITASSTWAKQNNISSVGKQITGKFLNVNCIGTYSSKYKKMIEDVININEEGDKKIFIYHDRVMTTGVTLIQEILKENNFIDEFSDPFPTTRCSICGRPLSKHTTTKSQASSASLASSDFLAFSCEASLEKKPEKKPSKKQLNKEETRLSGKPSKGEETSNKKSPSKIRAGHHGFVAARFILVHSGVAKYNINASIERYNSVENKHGHLYKILVGSRIIKESYELKDVRNLLIVSLPVNIPTLIQVFGRSIRNKSHINLSPKERIVTIRIYIHTSNTAYNTTGEKMSPEVYRYCEKLNDYAIIQKIERELNRNAVDAEINKGIITMSENIMPYTPAIELASLEKKPTTKINDISFLAYGFNNDEIHFIQYMIKRIFIWRRVWTYDDLLATVRKPPFSVEFNAAIIDEKLFVIALNNLLYDTSDIKIFKENNISTLGYRLFDYSDSYIYINNSRYKIQQVGKFYILFPTIDGKPIKDINSFISPIMIGTGIKIDMKRQFNQIELGHAFNIKRDELLKIENLIDRVNLFFSTYDDTFYFSLLREAISYFVKEQLDKKFKKSKYEKLYENMISLFDKFYMIVFAEELVKYKDAVQKFNNSKIIDIDKKVLKIDKDTPIGFISKKSILLYNNINWIEVNKIALNKAKIYKENNIVIGFFEGDEHNEIKFKLRDPIHKIQGEDITDARLIARGGTCVTKNKADLYQIAENLGIKTQHDERKIKTKEVCKKIQQNLLDREIKERAKDSNIKYVYLIHEVLPKISFR